MKSGKYEKETLYKNKAAEQCGMLGGLILDSRWFRILFCFCINIYSILLRVNTFQGIYVGKERHCPFICHDIIVVFLCEIRNAFGFSAQNIQQAVIQSVFDERIVFRVQRICAAVAPNADDIFIFWVTVPPNSVTILKIGITAYPSGWILTAAASQTFPLTINVPLAHFDKSI